MIRQRPQVVRHNARHQKPQDEDEQRLPVIDRGGAAVRRAVGNGPVPSADRFGDNHAVGRTDFRQCLERGVVRIKELPARRGRLVENEDIHSLGEVVRRQFRPPDKVIDPEDAEGEALQVLAPVFDGVRLGVVAVDRLKDQEAETRCRLLDQGDALRRHQFAAVAGPFQGRQPGRIRPQVEAKRGLVAPIGLDEIDRKIFVAGGGRDHPAPGVTLGEGEPFVTVLAGGGLEGGAVRSLYPGDPFERLDGMVLLSQLKLCKSPEFIPGDLFRGGVQGADRLYRIESREKALADDDLVLARRMGECFPCAIRLPFPDHQRGADGKEGPDNQRQDQGRIFMQDPPSRFLFSGLP